MILVSLGRTGSVKHPCRKSYATIFDSKIFGSGKSQILDFFYRFMKLFEFNQKLPSQIGGFVSMSENGCGCMRGGTQVFFLH